ncbi:MAG: adenosylmethionine--8-amino-7-oxononanoate transaminase [Oligoflexales bacterium]
MRVLILGTDTDIGKTQICAALCHGMFQTKGEAFYHKPLQTGGEHLDANFVKENAPGCLVIPGLCLSDAVAPTHAAQREKRVLPSIEELQPPDYNHLVVEGAGGIYVPVNFSNETWVEFARYHRLPVFVVARNRLGTINHTCLTVKALQAEGVDLRGVILSGDHHENTATLTEMLEIPLIEFPEMPKAAKNPLWQDACKKLVGEVERLFKKTPDFSDHDLKDLDSRHIWHPFTQHKTAPDPVIVERAQGVFVELSDGKKLLDCQSSWWVHNLGHGRVEVREAMFRQQRDLDHVIFAGTTHRPAVECAHRLLKFTPKLSKVFYSDNGSTAVEVGLKMAWQSHRNRGQAHRTKIAKLHSGYHGDTFGAMALGGSGFHDAFESLLFKTLTLHPLLKHAGGSKVDELNSWFQEHGDELSAVVIEPLMQGAGGMLLQDEEWLRQLATLCKEYGVYLVADEVFTGLGRTGKFLACQRAGIDPDIVCLAKGLTGGSIPFAATLATEEVFENFISDDSHKALLHGHTFAGNPIGCEIAISVLKLYEKFDFSEKSMKLEKAYQSWAQVYAQELSVRNLRVLGSILAVELPYSQTRSYFDGSANIFHQLAIEEGLLLRPLGNTVYLVPPLLISEEETRVMLDSWTRTLQRWNAFMTSQQEAKNENLRRSRTREKNSRAIELEC